MSCATLVTMDEDLLNVNGGLASLMHLVFLKHLDLYQLVCMILLEMSLNFALLYKIFWITLR